jgi:hypothetical protein
MAYLACTCTCRSTTLYTYIYWTYSNTAIVSDPRSVSIDPGSWNEASTRFRLLWSSPTKSPYVSRPRRLLVPPSAENLAPALVAKHASGLARDAAGVGTRRCRLLLPGLLTMLALALEKLQGVSRYFVDKARRPDGATTPNAAVGAPPSLTGKAAARPAREPEELDQD